MDYKIIWEDSAKDSYFDELEFILSKWNLNEIYKFEELVTTTLKLLSKKAHIANYSKETDLFRLIISKQTTLYFELIVNNI